MMETNLFLLGDQTYDITRGFRDLLQADDDVLLKDFLAKAFNRLRSEVSKLHDVDRTRVQRFSTWSDLLSARSKGELFPPLDQAIACAYQLGAFIKQCGERDGIYPQPDDSYVVGLCTGALASSAICSSRSLTELIPIGVETVIVAFHTGLCAVDVGACVEPTGSQLVSWSSVYAGLTYDDTCEKLDAFSKLNKLPKASQPFVSASSDQNVTISGPPSVLAKLRESAEFSEKRVTSINLHAPYHAPHLFTKDDVSSILECISGSPLATRPANLPMFSGASGNVIWAGNYRSLLEASLGDILLEPLRWDVVSPRINTTARATEGAKIKIHSISTNLGRSLARTLPASNSIDNNEGESPSFDSYNDSSMEENSDESEPVSGGGSARSKIAIVGMSGRFPDAESPSAFWDLLHEGLDVHKVVPARSWDVESHVDPTLKKKNTAATPYGCWLEHPELFDNKFFNISPREAPQIDPAQRLALMTAYEAIEQAGLVPDGSPSTQKDRVGIFYGCTSQDWMETNSAQNIDTYLIPGGNRAFIPGRINYSFKFSGPSLSIDTACSSSLAAINVACLSLWRGDSDTCIAGGTNVLTNPDFTAGLDRGHFLSRTGNCKTFDDGADGYCRGEGVGTVILKRLEDAIAENDPIQGVILGAYTNHSAEAESITRPHVGAQRDIFKKILDHRAIDPYDISYVEMHGTGTQAGDASEMSSVLETFAPAAARKRREDQKLYLGSAKANIGHGESVSGVSSLAKVLLMMKHNTIPPHVGIKTKLNHRFPTDLDDRQVFIAKAPTDWNRPDGGVRKVFINNFSAAGGNTALLLEDAPPVLPKVGEDTRPLHMVAVSARGPASLKGNLESLISCIDNMPEDKNALAQLSYTTTARRMHHVHRVVVRGADLKDTKAKLETALANKDGATRPKSSPKILFTFTGQGSQYPGMGKQLFDQFSSFRNDIIRFDQIAQQQGFPSFKPIITATKGNIADYTPLVVQLANVCLEMALFRFWKSLNISPASVVGHSLGEYGALNAAGVISESDTIFLVGRRAQLMQELCSRGTHSMLAVKSSAEEMTTQLKGHDYEIACINGPSDVVLSGKNEDIARIQEVLSSQKAKTTVLKVPYAFHSSQVDPVLEEFEASAQGITFRKPSIPVLCPLTGDVVEDAGVFGPSYLAKHCRAQVNMLGALQTGKSKGVITDAQAVLEVGPHQVVSGMVTATLGTGPTILASLHRGKDPWLLITFTIATLYGMGTNINWSEYHRDFEASHKVVSLPAYSWDAKPYWLQYVHDWSLHKGDDMVEANSPEAKQPIKKKEVENIDKAPKTPDKHPLESTTIHRVVEESVTDQGGKLIVEADIARADLNPFVQGHKVNEVPLCTPSVYADMAMSMGHYLLEQHRPNLKERLIDISDMVLERALVAQPKGPQLIRASGKINWAEKNVVVEFLSVDTNGKTTAKHSQCVIRFKDASEAQAHNKETEAARLRIKNLYDGLADCKTFRFSKNMAYRAVSSLAQFDENYQAMTEVVLDNENMEAATVVDLKDIKKGGSFTMHPAHMDSLSQSGGFVMNCNDKANLAVDIFVNHGWRSCQFYEKLSPEKKYRTHVRMHPGEDKMWEGDVTIYDGDKLVGRFGSVILQGVPRRLMNMILKQELGSKKPGGQPAKASPAAAQEKPKAKATPTPAPSSEAKATAESAPAVTKAAPKDAPATVPASPPQVQDHTKVFDIIAEESGLAQEDLTDSSSFSDLGIDSLLGMIITSRMKEELDIELESEEFLEFSSISDLRKWLSAKGGDAPAPLTTTPSEPSAERMEPEPVQTTPEPPKVSTEQQPAQDTVPAVKAPTKPVAAPKVPASSAATDSKAFDPVMGIVAEESGIAVEELTDDTSFADIGIDSLLSMLIAGRCKEELDLDLDSNEIFADAATIKDFKVALAPLLGLSDTPAEPEAVSSSSSTTGEDASSPELSPQASTPATEPSETSSELDAAELKQKVQQLGTAPQPTSAVKPATSVLLQGRPETASKTLFLFPDGSGSASSYVHLAKVSPDWAVIGLNCPYVRHPDEMKCTLDQLIGSYLAEIRRRQPQGPYSFGGWSAGGIIAYRACVDLIADGQEIDHLLLIDSPVPKGLDKLPQRFMDHCDKIGVWSHGMPGGKDASPPKRLVAHFNAVMDILGDYYADPLPEGKVPKTSIIWAAESVMDGVNAPKLPAGDDDVEDMKFLSETRTDFSASGWARLFPGTEVAVDAAKGANHFSMMQGEHGAKLSAWIKKSLQ